MSPVVGMCDWFCIVIRDYIINSVIQTSRLHSANNLRLLEEYKYISIGALQPLVKCLYANQSSFHKISISILMEKRYPILLLNTLIQLPYKLQNHNHQKWESWGYEEGGRLGG